MMKSLFGFDDLVLIFKVTARLKLPYLSPKMLVCTISHELVGRFHPNLHEYNWLADFIQIGMNITFGHGEELIWFW